jgi:Ca2+-binding RTX toxin-like protein
VARITADRGDRLPVRDAPREATMNPLRSSLALVCLGALVALPPAGAASAPAPAPAAEETCRGLPATIVVERYQSVTGTDGPDVIVAHGGAFDAGAGDDVVCLRGKAPSGELFKGNIWGDAGPGNDLVDATRHHGHRATITLGDGADRYYGGPAQDWVTAGAIADPAPGHVDDDIDVITTGPGRDKVTSGDAQHTDNADRVRLGDGNDSMGVHSGVSPDAVLRGGDGDNAIRVDLAQPGTWLLDDRADKATRDGTEVFRWKDFSVSLVTGDEDTPFRYRGTPDNDHLTVRAPLRGARLGAGRDSLAWPAPAVFADGVTGVIDGGRGRDSVRQWGGQSSWYVPGAIELVETRLDLSAGRMRVEGQGGGTVWFDVEVTGIEDAELDAFSVTAMGDTARNRFLVNGCRTTAKGGPGADYLQFERSEDDCDDGWQVRFEGQRGNDTLMGGLHDDVLIGGRGRDVANGRNGIDKCRAETRIRCER